MRKDPFLDRVRVSPIGMKKSIVSSIGDETGQGSITRRSLFRKLEQEFNCPVFTLFTSFTQPVSLSDSHADMLQDLLQRRTDLSRGLVLIVNSPGGYGLAAERVIRVCRALSGTGSYSAIVPAKAKSAATIVCMGAAKILMSPSSELGAVDPQIIRREDGRKRYWSAYNLVNSYDAMFKKAASAKGKNLAPYLQQLAKYDERDIETWRKEIALSEDMAINVLKSGMLNSQSSKQIQKRIQIFLNPSAGTKTHARPIFGDQAKKCGLVVEDINVKTRLWETIYELYLRTDNFVSSRVSSAIECVEGGYATPPVEMTEDDHG